MFRYEESNKLHEVGMWIFSSEILSCQKLLVALAVVMFRATTYDDCRLVFREFLRILTL